MIISRTPLRISFCGGGTDFAGYYKRESKGEVVSTAIDKYIYVGVNKKFGGKIRARWTKNETVGSIDLLEHNLIRESLRMTGINKAIEIEITSDIPSEGSGLGSSSTLAVGLLKALYRYKGYDIPVEELAERACHLEINVLGAAIGKQDQYAAAYGGLNHIIFYSDETVEVNNLYKNSMGSKITMLQDSTMLFYLNGRDSREILKDHQRRIREKRDVLRQQKELVQKMVTWLEADPNEMAGISWPGHIVSNSWSFKKEITPNATSDRIDNIFRDLIDNGAAGAKLCGAGGGGFLLAICEERLHGNIILAMKDSLNLKFKFEKEGAKIIYAD